jgi:hypothetical protein
MSTPDGSSVYMSLMPASTRGQRAGPPWPNTSADSGRQAVTEFPNNLPNYYLQTPGLHWGAQLKLLFRAGFAQVAHTSSKRTETSPVCAFCYD